MKPRKAFSSSSSRAVPLFTATWCWSSRCPVGTAGLRAANALPRDAHALSRRLELPGPRRHPSPSAAPPGRSLASGASTFCQRLGQAPDVGARKQALAVDQKAIDIPRPDVTRPAFFKPSFASCYSFPRASS